MKTKSFTKYLKKRLSKKEIINIKKQANFEVKILKQIESFLADFDTQKK